jgi:hypothetical protein
VLNRSKILFSASVVEKLRTAWARLHLFMHGQSSLSGPGERSWRGPPLVFCISNSHKTVILRACDLIPISFKATSIEHVLFMVGLLSGNRGKVRFCTVPLAIECSILSVFGARSSVLLVQPGFS